MTTTICRLHSKGDLRVEEIASPPLEAGEVAVEIARGGICGSDLHYFQHGGFGPVRVTEPIILGHEIAGVIKSVAPGVTCLEPGDKVAVNPSQPCNDCHFCAREEYQHCLNMRFLGSARTFPHVQGGFRSILPVPASQCVKVSAHTEIAHAACAEPLAVCLHAANQAGDLAGKRVLVTGAGPIGALCVAVSKARGASDIVVTDLVDFTLSNASKMGATHCVNIATSADLMDAFSSPEKQFDVVFECSGAEAAIAIAIEFVRPRGTLVQVGVAGSLNIPINAIVGKEISLKGTHRFHSEFADAVRMIDQGVINVAPMITQVFPVEQAHEAFATTLDRNKSIKVQLSFQSV